MMSMFYYCRSKHSHKEGLVVLLSCYFLHPCSLESHMSADYLLCQPQDGTIAQSREHQSAENIFRKINVQCSTNTEETLHLYYKTAPNCFLPLLKV